MKKYLTIAYMILTGVIMPSCKKEFLDKKPNKALLVPTTLEDFQALLDYAEVMNATVGLSNVAADDLYRTDANLSSLEATERNSYLWNADIFEGASSKDWSTPYQAIFQANVVLDGIRNIARNPGNQQDWDRIKGSALFFRGFELYHLSQLFAVPYDVNTASSVLGIPIRLSSDVNIIAGRGTLQQTYDRVLQDLTDAATLLPDKSSAANRPNKAAAYGYLSRVYLTMGAYDKAVQYATSYLGISNVLIDYNTLTASTARPLPNGNTNANAEVLFVVMLNGYTFVSSTTTFVNPALYAQYSDNDLRKTCFFASRSNGNYTFKGSYLASATSFGGPATDEMYLTRAECYARQGKLTEAMQDLNTVISKRWKKTAVFPAFTAADQKDALNKILTERRKELINRGVRWIDLRRLNRDPVYAISLQRSYNSTSFILQPNSNRYTFPIPNDEIMSSGIEQNNR
ncbi:RagB/SusD family nutrient uptake outer membrane protein [Mucilaginibacter litoreus]|uniref:RagB/SusD family nutrient uptake outer membrane protein n=1 Tax=Mucilaginibacter litoreus TaxID=1048221 RepID=A0ABW3AXE7_9SPHI